MALLTAQGLRDILERSQNDDLPDLGADEFLDFANRFNQEVYVYLYNANTKEYRVKQTITTVVDQEVYTISGDIDNVRPISCGLIPKNCEQSLLETDEDSKQRGFYIIGNTVGITPKPTTVENFTFRYIPVLPQLTLYTDTTVIDERYSQFIKDSLNISFYEWSKDGREIGSSQRVRSSFNEFVRRIPKQPKNYVL